MEKKKKDVKVQDCDTAELVRIAKALEKVVELVERIDRKLNGGF